MMSIGNRICDIGSQVNTRQDFVDCFIGQAVSLKVIIGLSYPLQNGLHLLVICVVYSYPVTGGSKHQGKRGADASGTDYRDRGKVGNRR
jgi:hypothetical protein